MSLNHQELASLERAAATLCTPFAYGDLDGWRSAVNRSLCPIVEADLAVFFLAPSVTGAEAECGLIWSDELSRDQAADFVRDALYDAGTDRALAFGLTVMTQRELVRDDWDLYYADHAVNAFYVPNQLLDAIGFMSWGREGRKQASIEIHKDVFGTALFGEEGAARLRLLLPAFQAGIAAVQSLAATRTGLAVLLDRVGEALALTDARGTVLHRTEALDRLLGLDPDGARLASTIASLAAQQAALFEARGWGRRHRSDGCALEAGAAATMSTRTRGGTYRLSVVEAPEVLTNGRLAFLVRVEPTSSGVPSAHGFLRFGLTDRETEVARLLAAGASNDRIAAALGISPHTARRHTERVLGKLHVRSRAAVGAALRGDAEASAEQDGPAKQAVDGHVHRGRPG